MSNTTVIFHPEVEEWHQGLQPQDLARVTERVKYLTQNGPAARRPIVGKIENSRHANMKELICPGDIRILFAFDPRSQAILLVGGAKTNRWNSWYKEAIPLADDRFDEWLADTNPG